MIMSRRYRNSFVKRVPELDKEHQGEGGRLGRFVGPHAAGEPVGAFTLRSARVHDADGPSAKRRTEARDTRRDRPIFTESSCSA
jgi:hypothetical protein